MVRIGQPCKFAERDSCGVYFLRDYTKIVAGGDILIKYHDGAVYDGPYILEACLSVKGTVSPGEIVHMQKKVIRLQQ